MTVSLQPPAIETANVLWQDGQPFCQRFRDVYFTRGNGLEETRHVFIQPNRLAERFTAIGAGEHFVVAETGFGTGLNFLATWQLWQQETVAQNSCLHFISVERYPLERKDLARALSLWPELSALAEELLESYPDAIHGTHRLVLANGRVRLTLYLGDVLKAWESLAFTADAWFLDGFAPACNPAMWQQKMLTAVAQHSHPGTTISTFTAAGFVRRRLAEAGFTMSKAPGFGSKRDMLVGQFNGNPDPGPCPTQRDSTVAIIGAGVSGAMLAANLSGRGLHVTLIDKEDGIAAAASGNSQGALYVKLGVDFNDQTELALSSLLFAQRFYTQYEGPGWHPSGLIQLAYNEAEADRQRRFQSRNQYPESVVQPVDANTATKLAGLQVPYSGLWFPSSGWLQPPELCANLIRHPGISQRLGFDVTAIRPGKPGWYLTSSNGEELFFDRIVLCAGASTPELIPYEGQFRIKAIRGQISEVTDSKLNSPSLVLCGPGYVNPTHRGKALVGATFDLHDRSSTVTDQSHRENLNMLAGLLPDALRDSVDSTLDETVAGRVAFRCTTHDYQPIVGLMKTPEGSPVDGVYLFTGLGSKGLTYATLMAEYLGDVISSQPVCLPRNLIRRVDTQRCHRPKVT